MGMERRRWLNPTQPQTLQIAVMLLYLNAALGLLSLIIGGAAGLFGIAIIAAEILGAYGIANERKWGYIVGLVAAVLPLALVVLAVVAGVASVLGLGIIGVIFQIALVALLLHPQSREYQRIWFK
ncbi:MAG TPA: hypothetical protein VGF64_09115 [Acidimicrobiales bacterium]|jgi:hypothetical protein